MSVQCEVSIKQAAGAPMSVFERWLTLWVALCILVGIGLGQWLRWVAHLGNDHPHADEDRL
jgi:ACR3 family arsenite transporter